MMHEYYEKARKDAREAMGNLIKQTADDNIDDMVKALAYAKFFNQTLPSVSPSAIQ